MMPLLPLLLACVDGKPGESSASRDSSGPDTTDTARTDSPPDSSTTPPCDSADEVTWYLDADGDGFGVEEETVRDCVAPEGYAAQAGDCDDAHANAFPGNEDVWGDGVDGDCDGVDACGDGVVWEGNLRFDEDATPAEAAAFCKEYDIVTGTLKVYGTDWTDLTGLECLCGVGDLEIEGNMSLLTLAGLEGLRSVAPNPDAIYGNIWIWDALLLDDLQALGGIAYFQGGVDVAAVGPNNDLSGLEWMVDLPYGFGVFGQVGSLHGARNLTTTDQLMLSSLDNPTLDGLESLTHVGEWGITFRYLHGITSVPALPSLAQVDGPVHLEAIGGLTDMTGFPPLAAIGGGLEIAQCNGLETLDGLDALEEVGGSLVIYRADALRSLRGLEGLRRVEGNLELRELDRVTDISALYGVEYVGGCILVETTPWLADEAYDELVAAIGEENIGTVCW